MKKILLIISLIFIFLLNSRLTYGENDIRDVFGDGIKEINNRQEEIYSKKYNVRRIKPGKDESFIKNGLQLQNEEINRIIQEKNLKMEKILSEKKEDYQKLNQDYLDFLSDYENDKIAGDMGILIIVGLGQGELVNVDNNSIYILPYKSFGDDKGKEYILKKLEDNKNNLEKFQNVLQKFGINAILVRPTVDYEFYLGEKDEIKKSTTVKLFSSTDYSITEPTIKDFLKKRTTLYYFGYIPSYKLKNAFGEKNNIRSSDMFLNFGDKFLYLGIYNPNKNVYFSSLVKTDDGILYYYSYTYNIFAQYYTIIFIILGLILGYFSALGFLNKQRNVISLIQDKI